MFKQICCLTGVTALIAALGSSLLSGANAQITDQKFQSKLAPSNVPIVGQATPGNSPRPAVQTNFQGRGVAQGSAFTRGRTATTVLTIDRDNFVFELAEPGGRTDAPRARVQYRGAIIRQTNKTTSATSGGFTLDGRVRSYTSSANLRVLNNTTGTCRIEVFNSLVLSSSCRAATAESSTQFLGLEQF
ncbi:hypothetical protein C7B65_14895 [Phormidesmis priestleyi ULC007]|uniref:Uncharacterized protein n=1 Tax=Phormidesmis priestleyi ULC007 TaxID=1920490 RepID=A0A2T1DDS9_9CYAN|nr:hypothetical protein [Phormidesmis priestleyi]PSB18617.1 hypothetical protein C7B65_14895 [Phormidesmis priestleyi ULC007]PZO49845.1 MAG: hypothetical protein DCF14_13185 [Phormidesmis priestleyi]